MSRLQVDRMKLPAIAVHAVSIAACSAVLAVPIAARAAVGFTGGLAPENWHLSNTYFPTSGSATSNTLTLDYADYVCGSVYTVSCVNDTPPPLPPDYTSTYDDVATVTVSMVDFGNFTLIGSDDNEFSPSGGGASGKLSTANFYVANGSGSNWIIAFDYNFVGFSDSTSPPAFGVYVDNVGEVLSSGSGGAGRYYVSVANGQTLSLRITTLNDGTFAPYASISGFGEVPAPLPAFGAASALGFSRRLRKRIARDKQIGGCIFSEKNVPSLSCLSGRQRVGPAYVSKVGLGSLLAFDYVRTPSAGRTACPAALSETSQNLIRNTD